MTFSKSPVRITFGKRKKDSRISSTSQPVEDFKNNPDVYNHLQAQENYLNCNETRISDCAPVNSITAESNTGQQTFYPPACFDPGTQLSSPGNTMPSHPYPLASNFTTPAMSPPVVTPPAHPFQPFISNSGIYPSPPNPLAAMEQANWGLDVTKRFIKNQKEQWRNVIISIKQAALGQKSILPLQAGPITQNVELYLPQLIANITESLHQVTGFCPGGLALGVLAGISIATQGRAKIKLTPQWHEPAIDMVLNISESGTMKSSVVDILMKPFTEYANKLNEVRRADRQAKRTAAKLAQNTAAKVARNKIKEAMGSDGDIAAAIEEAAQDEQAILAPYKNLNKPDIKLLISKGTPHQVAKRLQEQGMCQGCITDEGDMLRSGLLGKGGDPELFLKGHTQGEYAYPAAGGDIHVRPSLPMIHFVTPAVSAALYANEAKKGVEGVTARFVPYFMTGGGGGSTFASDTAFAEYYSLINELLETYHTQEAGAEKYEVDVTPEAVDLLYSFKAEIQDIIIPNMPEAAAPYLRKAHGQAARFAWDIHAAEMGSAKCKPHLQPIQANTIEQAIALVRVTFDHIRWICDPRGFPAYNLGKEVVRSLLRISPEEWQNVLSNGIDSTTLQQRVGTKSTEMNNALRFLERYNVIAVYDDGTRNLKVVLNPFFFRANWRELGVSHN